MTVGQHSRALTRSKCQNFKTHCLCASNVSSLVRRTWIDLIYFPNLIVNCHKLIEILTFCHWAFWLSLYFFIVFMSEMWEKMKCNLLVAIFVFWHIDSKAAECITKSCALCKGKYTFRYTGSWFWNIFWGRLAKFTKDTVIAQISGSLPVLRTLLTQRYQDSLWTHNS